MVSVPEVTGIKWSCMVSVTVMMCLHCSIMINVSKVTGLQWTCMVSVPEMTGCIG